MNLSDWGPSNGTLDPGISMEDYPMCDLGGFQDTYFPVHGPLSLVVCTVGILFNLLNILVLSHPDMRTNHINLILAGIAVADMLLLLEYLPFTLHMYILGKDDQRDREERLGFAWGVFMLFHANFSIMIHTTSIWLTLSLAVWRFIMIKFHALAVTLCTLLRCKTVLVLGYVVPALLTIPNLLSASLVRMEEHYPTGNITVYRIQMTDYAGLPDGMLYRANIWFYSFFLKLVPCIVLTIITAGLVRALIQAMNRAQRLRQGKRQGQQQKDAGSSRQKKTDRTTRLLIVILILFLLTEFPQAILGLVSAALGVQFLLDCYTPLAELMDMMALLNCGLNFLLYCLMSRQFRATGRKIFGLSSPSQPLLAPAALALTCTGPSNRQQEHN